MNRPLVSVIIPTYNRSHLIKRAVNSVLNQTFIDFELIIVDDASTDDTEEIIKTITDPRIHYIKHKKNKERSAARNTGIKSAKGFYLAFLDDDDEWLPEKLEKQVKIFQMLQDSIGVLYTGVIYCSKEHEKKIKLFPKNKGFVFLKFLKESFMNGSTPLIRSECFERIGYFDENFNNAEDWDLWLRISEYYKFDFVPEILTITYVHGSQSMSSIENIIEGLEEIVKKYHFHLENNPSIYSEHMIRLGVFNIINNNSIRAKNYFSKAIILNKFQIKGYIHLFFTIALFKVYRRSLLFFLGRFKITGLTLDLL